MGRGWCSVCPHWPGPPHRASQGLVPACLGGAQGLQEPLWGHGECVGDWGVPITSVGSLQVPGDHEHPDKHRPDHADLWWAHSGKNSRCLGSKHSSFKEVCHKTHADAVSKGINAIPWMAGPWNCKYPFEPWPLCKQRAAFLLFFFPGSGHPPWIHGVFWQPGLCIIRNQIMVWARG